MQWSSRTWPELSDDLSATGYAAILPVGATEQHGPHLGTGVDFVIAEKLCAAVAERTRVLVLPCIPFGCSLGHSRRWPGTLAVQPITLINYVKDVGDWAYYSGVRRLFIVNAHVTNAAPLRCTLEMLRASHDDLMVALINTPEISARVHDFHFLDGQDWHANDAETSVMMAVSSDFVRPKEFLRADDPDRTGGLVFAHPVNRTSSNGVTGAPSKASAEKGKIWFDMMVEDLASTIACGKTETPPLMHSYFTSLSEDRT